MHWFLSICVKMFFCLTSVATPLLWLLWVCAAAKFANINLFYVWEEKLYFTLCKSNGPPCPYVCNGPGRRFPQKIWKTHFLCLPSNIIRRRGIASSVLKGRRSILNLDVRTNLETNLNAVEDWKRGISFFVNKEYIKFLVSVLHAEPLCDYVTQWFISPLLVKWFFR